MPLLTSSTQDIPEEFRGTTQLRCNRSDALYQSMGANQLEKQKEAKTHFSKTQIQTRVKCAYHQESQYFIKFLIWFANAS